MASMLKVSIEKSVGFDKKRHFFYRSIQQITRFPGYLNVKNSGELAVLFLRQLPISWKERLFYLQRDYVIFISLQCIDFRPTEYEDFETEPNEEWLQCPIRHVSFHNDCFYNWLKKKHVLDNF